MSPDWSFAADAISIPVELGAKPGSPRWRALRQLHEPPCSWHSRRLRQTRHDFHPWQVSSCADYFSGSPNAVAIDGADAALNRYGTWATSS